MVTTSEIENVAQSIVRMFRPQRVILFGSHARGTAGEDSDVDLLVILPFEESPLRKSVDILNRLDVRFPLDLIARRPDDVERRYREGDPLIREALDHGTTLYAQRDR